MKVVVVTIDNTAALMTEDEDPEGLYREHFLENELRPDQLAAYNEADVVIVHFAPYGAVMLKGSPDDVRWIECVFTGRGYRDRKVAASPAEWGEDYDGRSDRYE